MASSKGRDYLGKQQAPEQSLASRDPSSNPFSPACPGTLVHLSLPISSMSRAGRLVRLASQGLFRCTAQMLGFT